jgi:hypothetical protein
LITHVALERDASGVIAEAQFAKEASVCSWMTPGSGS